jgi:hypothetical protein
MLAWSMEHGVWNLEPCLPAGRLEPGTVNPEPVNFL